jgi:hypothetical protein
MDAFFEQNYVWQVDFDTQDTVAEVILSYQRALPDGKSVKFDEDSNTILDLAADADDHLVMDGFLALIPPGELLSCAMRVSRRALLIWEYMDYQHIFAEYDKQVVERAFDTNGLFNTDGSIDALFIGGDRVAHESATILSWVRSLSRDVISRYETEGRAVWAPALDVYTAIIYTQTTEIHMLTRNEHKRLRDARSALNKVAARYGLVLPPTSFKKRGT